jgi:hypothetical protein
MLPGFGAFFANFRFPLTRARLLTSMAFETRFIE